MIDVFYLALFIAFFVLCIFYVGVLSGLKGTNHE